MSDSINTRLEQREALKGIILALHQGRTPEEMKEQFRDLLQSVGATEIAELEGELISAGLPETEVKRLCDVHVAVFEEALQAQAQPETVPGHPVHTFRLENRAIERVIEGLRGIAGRLQSGTSPMTIGPALAALREGVEQLATLEKHYLRKEHLLFPALEKRGIKGPTNVMWGIHDEIRAGWKGLRALLGSDQGKDLATVRQEALGKLTPLIEMVSSMIYKEENILFPMSLERLSEDDWRAIHAESDDVGYTLVTPGRQWPLTLEQLTAEGERGGLTAAEAAGDTSTAPDGLIPLDTGALSARELNLMLTHLPVDITFVDKEDTVRYFSAGPERIFLRTEAAIGRRVQDCHPPKSLHIVERILNDFKAGRRDVAEFWIDLAGGFVHIRYFAVRDKGGEYIGTLEVTQDITSIRKLEGQRRLLADA